MMSFLQQNRYLVVYCVPLIVNESLGHTSPIDRLLVSCLILSVVTPTPSVILLHLQSLDLQSLYSPSSCRDVSVSPSSEDL